MNIWGTGKTFRLGLLVFMLLGFAAVGIVSNHFNPNGIAFQRKPHIKQLGAWNQGEIVNFDFIIVNPGQEPLVIERVAPDCSCAVSELKTNVIPPGSAIPLPTTLDTATEEDKIRKRVRVSFTSGEKEVYTLFAEVTPIFSVEPDKLIALEVDRRRMKTTEYKRTFRFVPVDNGTRVLDYRIEKDHFDVSMVTLDRNKGFEFTIRAKDTIPLGDNKFDLTMTIDHPRLGRYPFRYPIMAMVTDGFKIDPAFLYFGVMTQPKKERVKLISEVPFNILDVYPCPTLDSAEIEFFSVEEFGGRLWIIYVTLDPDTIEIEDFEGTIHVKTDLTDYPEITVRVLGSVRGGGDVYKDDPDKQ